MEGMHNNRLLVALQRSVSTVIINAFAQMANTMVLPDVFAPYDRSWAYRQGDHHRHGGARAHKRWKIARRAGRR